VNVVASDAPPPLLKLFDQIYKQFDWRALAAMVER
jgi:membrane-bound lytic murein transglycosylase MltF